uniref:Uncharacterized protein n=1 Tax=Avena sativa TaxID=4498 RepID=A0ACD5XHB0_AVESA
MEHGPMDTASLNVDPMAKLTDDILADIISRVPYKSSCCCKCVSTRWRDLISHPDHRKKMPQSLAGFFYESYYSGRSPRIARHFTNISGNGEPLIDSSLSFLPKYCSIEVLDCCNGLLLCRCWKPTDPTTLDYVVCNPATEKWVVVPATEWSSKVNVARLGFEPAVSSHFHVFEFIDEEAWGIDESELSDCHGCIKTLSIYSSKAGVWKHQIPVEFDFAISGHSRGFFLDGVLHLATSGPYKFTVAVDVEGNDWWIIDMFVPPYYDDARYNDIFPWQRQLYLASRHAGCNGSELSVWALEDYNIEEWTLKDYVSHLEMFGAEYSAFADHLNVISFHPDRNMIFMICGHGNALMSYDMDRKKMCFLRQFGQDCQPWGVTPILPYVPLFSEAPADGY